jgi:hypothetical protein
MRRVWNFLRQDADAAMDRITQPYVRFVLAHRPIMWGVHVAVLFLIWALISKTLAIVLVGIMIALLVYGVIAALWRRRSQ